MTRTRSALHRFRFALIAMIAALMCLMATPTVHAASKKAEARKLVKQAEKHIKKGEYDEAIAKFEEADEVIAVPAHTLMIGRLHLKMDRLIEASEAFETAAGYPVKRGIKRGSLRAIKAAKKELKAVEPRIPSLKIKVLGADPDRVLIDGEEVDDPASKMTVPINPGDHTVAAEAEGMEPAEEEVSVEEGEKVVVKLRLKKAEPEEDPDPEPEDDDGEDDDEGSGGLAIAGWVMAGFGLAGVATGAITGALSMSTASDLAAICGDDKKTCPDAEQDNIDSGTLLGHLSTVGFAVGGTLLAVGVILVLVDDGPSDDDGGDSARWHVGPGGVGVRF